MNTVAMIPSLEVAERTDAGRDPEKQTNEDAFGNRATRFGHLAVVCDGMGGHLGGKEASARALAAIFETFENAPVETAPRDVLRRAIELANERVWALAPPDAGASRPGSTAVAILVHASGVEVAHVGDSRCYRVHAGKVAQLTKDHSLVQGLVDAGMLSAADAKNHPDANRITRALGTRETVEVELAPAPVALVAGDQFLLCSDGLSDLVEPEDILGIAGTQPPAQAVGRLVDLANARGGHDNITVVIVRVREGASATNVAPTVAQTIAAGPVTKTLIAPAEDPNPPPGRTTPPLPVADRERKSHASLYVGLATAAYVLWFGLHHSDHHHRAPVVTPSTAPTPAETPDVAPPSATPEIDPAVGDLPPLHRPDAAASPDLK